ncbi:MAG: MaoC family dehydratase N-terminal domain-containing protein [Sulfitobacter sp.]|nr:MaoC family dehydratase N-terminal domain-containing protein [Sulfitobacter sp.]
MDQINLDSWTGRSDRVAGGLSSQQAALVQATLGTAMPIAQGDALPPLWHWYAFPPTAPTEALGPDGHPRLGDFMPPLRLNRRMWAGGSIEFHGRLTIGEPLERRTRIARITEKTGAAGEIVVVTLDHDIFGARGLAISERQDLVYLQIPDSYAPPRKKAAPVQPDLEREVPISEPLLFRYSAITFNAHRIHYDLPYTQQTEKYPDLVVHGPLQAQLLMQLAQRERGHAPRLFSYRGIHPLFASDSLTVMAVKHGCAEWDLAAVAGGCHVTMQATATWEV